MGLLQTALLQDGYELSEIRITLAQDAPDGQVTVTAEAVNRLGHRTSKSCRINGHDVAGLEHVPDALRRLGLAWLYDDPVAVVSDFIRTVKKERRPSKQ